MGWHLPQIFANVAEHEPDRVKEYVPTLMELIQQTDGQMRCEAARAIAAIAATHPEIVVSHIHDLVLLLDVEETETNEHLARAIMELLRSDSITGTVDSTKKTAVRTLWRSEAFNPAADGFDPIVRTGIEGVDRSQRRRDIFTLIPENTGVVRIYDRIDQRQLLLESPNDINTSEIGTDAFRYPVDCSFEITAERLRIPTAGEIFVRGSTETVIPKSGPIEDDPVELEEKSYLLELPAPIKTYLKLHGQLRIHNTERGVELRLEEESNVQIGVRSNHEHPTGVITTTEDPRDMMAALSTLGSALKTTTSERSYPTLRGHPPTIELGDELDIPPNISRVNTGVMVEVPPEYETIFTVAPLAYYLGADIVPGQTPRLVTSTGYTHQLEGPNHGFEAEVERVLKQAFLFDCLIRTEGYYQVDLAERDEVEALVDVDFEKLYGKPLGYQLERILQVPFDLVEPFVPTWQMTTCISPNPDNVEEIPYLVNDLSIIRTQTEVSASGVPEAPPANELLRADYNPGDPGNDVIAGNTTSVSQEDETLVQISDNQADAFIQNWVGDGLPRNRTKAIAEGYRNHLNRAASKSAINITVVCNDEQMHNESLVGETYGINNTLAMNTDVHYDLTTAELEDVLNADVDFFHYIGHITQDGFLCSDGYLDARDLEKTGVATFILNACNSHNQGRRLIEAGAGGGIVTLNNVTNSVAIRVGRALACLLNKGFTLHDALQLANRNRISENMYSVIGNGTIEVAQPEGGLLTVYDVTTTDDDTVSVSLVNYPSGGHGLGALVRTFISNDDRYRLALGEFSTLELSHSEFGDLLNRSQNAAIIVDGELKLNGTAKVANPS